MTVELASQYAAQHGFALEVHECCVILHVPYSGMDGRRGIELIPATTFEGLRIALGY